MNIDIAIGSDFFAFCKQSVRNSNDKIWESKLLQFLSGRTVLDFIANGLFTDSCKRSILIPSYSCDTMIIPFVDNKINVSFYDVSVDSSGICIKAENMEETDAIVVMNYFGFQSPAVETFIDKMAGQNKTIIKDATQSLFSESSYDSRADYVFASLRKWMGVPDGALLAKRDGKLSMPQPENTNEAYVDTRLLAMKMKKAFQERNEGNKNDYLKKFAEAAGILQKDYTNYRMSNQSLELLQFLDTDLLIKSRKQNAAFLIAELQTISQLELIFNEVKEQDVPLFVPILVKNGMRDKLSQYLISKEIFCPVHWPISKWHTISEKSKEIYHQELSLVCDQRYNLNDMARLVQEIRNFFNNT